MEPFSRMSPSSLFLRKNKTAATFTVDQKSPCNVHDSKRGRDSGKGKGFFLLPEKLSNAWVDICLMGVTSASWWRALTVGLRGSDTDNESGQRVDGKRV